MTRAVSIALLLMFMLGRLDSRTLAEEKPEVFQLKSELDAAVLEFMQLVDAQAATVAVSRDGKLLYSQGYGSRTLKEKSPVLPTTLFRIASVSKPITAAAIKTAIRQKKISLDTKVFDFLEMTKAHGEPIDLRLKDITVEHLLKHKGGWDRDIGFDPMFQGVQVLQFVKPNQPITPDDVVSYMWQQTLQFPPGEKSAYSNFGYCVLGRVLEKAYDKPYIECVRQLVLEPHDIDEIELGTSDSSNRPRSEVEYPIKDNRFLLDVMDAHGGLTASAPAICRFLDAYWISGDPRKSGQDYAYTFFGSLPGTTSVARQRSDGYNIAVMLNNRRDDHIYDDLEVLKKSVDRVFDDNDQLK